MSRDAPPPSDQSIEIERAVPGGEGLGRDASGRVVFVPGAFPGDRVRVVEATLHRGYQRASRWELESASPDRRVPPCPIADRCGGCDWMALGDAAQRRYKLSLMEDAFTRVGKFRSLPCPIEFEAGSPLRYRSRVRLQIGKQGTLSFIARASHEHVPITACIVCTPELEAALSRVRAYFEHASEPSLPRGEQLPSRQDCLHACEFFGQLELRALAAVPEVWLIPRHTRRGARPQLPSALEPWLAALGAEFRVEVDGARPSESWQPLALADVELQIAPGAFTQVNWEINSRLVEDVVRGAQLREVRSFLDLYSGLGNFTLPLLRAGLEGIGVESNARSVEGAQRAAQAAGLAATFVCADVAAWVHRTAAVRGSALERRQASKRAHAQRGSAKQRAFDLVICDPPRAGVGSLASGIAALCRRWLFYCACDPVSLARDARSLGELGFELRELRAHDMFPQTHHVELTAWFERRRDAPLVRAT